MAEENNQQQPQAPSQQQLDLQAETASVLTALGGALSEETRAALMQQAGAQAPPVNEMGGANEGGQKVDPFANETGAVVKEEEAQPNPDGQGGQPAAEGSQKPADEQKPAPAANEKKDILGLGKKAKPQQPQANELKFEKIEDVLSGFGKNLGMELKTAEDLNKVLEQTKQWRTSAQALKKTQEDYDQLVKGYQSLPEEFHEAVKAYSEGKDYKQVFAQQKFDYKKPVEEVDVKDLVKHYFPDDFVEDDFTAEEPSPAFKIAEKAAKQKYEIERGQLEAKRAQDRQRVEQSVKAFNDSIVSSAKNLTDSFPDADVDGINTVQELMKGGIQGIASVLMENGVYKPDAAKKLLFLLHGEDIISDMAEIAANQRETQINEELLKTATDKPAPVRSSPAGEAKSPLTDEQQRELESLKRTAEIQREKNSVL